MTECGRFHKKGRVASAICHLFGSIILILVILALLPITLPRLMGYEIFSVASGSMEPEIPVGSIVYVKPAEPVNVAEGEIIAFSAGSSVVMHRVVSNHQVDEYFTTKGDANPKEDMGGVRYENLIGRVVRHIPLLGQVMQVCAGLLGKVLISCLAGSGILLLVLAGMIAGKNPV